MRRCSSILILFVFLGFGVSLAVPAEDVPETTYDEPEALPYDDTPLFSIVVPLVAARTTQAVSSSLRHGLGAPSLFAPARVRETDADSTHRCTNLIGTIRFSALLATSGRVAAGSSGMPPRASQLYCFWRSQ